MYHPIHPYAIHHPYPHGYGRVVFPRVYHYVPTTADERAFTELVRHIATEESSIELSRQTLSINTAFVHGETFKAIAGCAGDADENKEGEEEKAAVISAADLLHFVQSNIEGQEDLRVETA